jgi:hypothetical protein
MIQFHRDTFNLSLSTDVEGRGKSLLSTVRKTWPACGKKKEIIAGQVLRAVNNDFLFPFLSSGHEGQERKVDSYRPRFPSPAAVRI